MSNRVRVNLEDLEPAPEPKTTRYWVGYPKHLAPSGPVVAEVIPKGETPQIGMIGEFFKLKKGAATPRPA